VTPTREQLVDALRRWTPNPSAAVGAADAVLDLLCDAELDAEGVLREQLTARYEQRLAKALAEAPQSKVLWSGDLGDLCSVDGANPVGGKPGTRVVVVEDTAPPVTEDPGRCVCGPRDDDPSDPDPDCPQHGHLVRPVTEGTPPPAKVTDLMAALEESVNEAKAERDRHLAARAEDTPGGTDAG